MLPLLFLFCLVLPSNGQFAEIASLATSLLGGGLGAGGLGGLAGLAGGAGQAAGAAGGAAGALGQIGQLYQLAQGALQLTGTGVGVLNQASEGNWFPAALEHAAKNQEQLRMGGGHGGLGGGLGGGGLGGLMGLGPLAPGGRNGASGSGGANIGPEFGTNFPAPDIDDYNDEKEEEKPTTPKTPFGLTDIDDKDLEGTVATTSHGTTTESVTLFPDEENSIIESTSEAPKKQIRIIELPQKQTGFEDYEDKITSGGDSQVEIPKKRKPDVDANFIPELPERASGVHTLQTKGRGGVPDLSKLIEALRKSNLKEEEIHEIVMQVEGNERVEVPPKIDFNSGVQNIGNKKAANRARIITASRKLNGQLGGQNNGNKELEAQVNELRVVPDLSPVTLPPAPVVTTAPYVHHVSTIPTVPSPVALPYQITHALPAFNTDSQANRLQREIQSPAPTKESFPIRSSQIPGSQLHFQPQPIPQPQAQVAPQQQAQVAPHYQQPYQQPQPAAGVQQLQQGSQQQPYAAHQLYHQHLLQQINPQYNQQTTNYNQQNPNYNQQNANYNQQAQNYNQQLANYNQYYYNQQQQHHVLQQQQGIAQPQPPQQIQQLQQRPQQLTHSPLQYRQLQQVSGQAAIVQQGQHVIYTNQQGAHPVFFSQPPRVPTQTIPLPLPKSVQQHGVTNVQQNPKSRSTGYTNQRAPAASPHLLRHLRESSIRTTQPFTPVPRRLFPTRTARTLALTTPSPVGERRSHNNNNNNNNQQLTTNQHNRRHAN